MTRTLKLLTAGTLTLAAVGLVSPLNARARQGADRTIYVSVMTNQGAPVPDMTAADFVVKEDGATREVAGVARATEPISYAVLVDTTSKATANIIQIREAIKDFSSLLLQADPKTQISYTQFGGAAMTVREMTSSPGELDAALGKLVPTQSESVLNEAFVEVAKKMAKMPEHSRRVIISINMEPAAESSSIQAKQVAEEVRKAGAVVWAVSLQDGTRRDTTREQLLKGLAANTGGRAVIVQNANVLPQVLRTFAANSFSQYAVTIKGSTGTAKMTDVTVTRPETVALALKWNSK
jgi:Ca-activated chloride channel family protein